MVIIEHRLVTQKIVKDTYGLAVEVKSDKQRVTLIDRAKQPVAVFLKADVIEYKVH